MSEDAAFAAAQAGQVDVAYTAASYAQQSVSGYTLLAAESVDNRGLNLPAIPSDGDKGNDVTADPAIRQAINRGIDRQQLIDHVLYGYGTPAYSVCDKLPWFSAHTIVEHDFDGAISLLENAGWAAGADGIREKDGVRASLKILYPASDSLRQAMAAETANQLKLLGIEAAFEGVGWDVAYERALSEPLIWGWGAHTPMEVYNMYHAAPGEEYAAYSPYANPAADALMDEALASGDLEASYKLWQEAQSLISQDAPWIWLANIDHLYWVRDGLQVAQQKIHPHGHGWSIVNNVDQWAITVHSS
jgi:peptide/nickel transport system substrate-binding protein